MLKECTRPVVSAVGEEPGPAVLPQQGENFRVVKDVVPAPDDEKEFLVGVECISRLRGFPWPILASAARCSRSAAVWGTADVKSM
jgi:hypothetical protein